MMASCRHATSLKHCVRFSCGRYRLAGRRYVDRGPRRRTMATIMPLDGTAKIWNGFVRGLGLRSGDEPRIDYRERSPLVVPPTRDLPPPQAKAVAAQGREWPDDPDAKRAKERATPRRTASGSTATRSSNKRPRQNAMTPEQLNPTPAQPDRRAAPGAVTAQKGRTDRQRLLPSELGYFGGHVHLGRWALTVRRTRYGPSPASRRAAALTEPPAGYQTPSPAQPYGIGRRRANTAKRRPARARQLASTAGSEPSIVAALAWPATRIAICASGWATMFQEALPIT